MSPHRLMTLRSVFRSKTLPPLLAAGLALLAAACEPTPPPPQTRTVSTGGKPALNEPFASYMEAMETGAVCIVNRPLRREPVPVVVLAHQFNSEAAQPTPPMQILSERLASHGIATYRLYYDVSPAADAFSIEYDSTARLIEEVDIVFEQLRIQHWVDTNRVGLVGYDIGAIVGVCAAVDAPFQPRAMVLWSPPKDFREGFTRLLRHEPVADRILVHFEDRRVVLTANFASSLDNQQPLAKIKEFKGALLGITGSDSTEGLAALRQFIANSGASSHDSLVIEKADASLGIYKKDSPATKEAIEATADWLERAL
jgi:dienelactone hydrolase